MDVDLGDVEREFGPNKEELRSYKRGLGFVLAMGIVGLGIWISGLINNQEFDWLVFIPSLAMLAISGKLLLMVHRSYSFIIEVRSKGLRVKTPDAAVDFPWNEISLIEESELGDRENSLKRLLLLRKDNASHLLTSQLVSSFDELANLLESAAKSKDIPWKTATENDL